MRLNDSRLNLLDMKLERLTRGFTDGPCRFDGSGPLTPTRFSLIAIAVERERLNKEEFGPFAILWEGPFGRTYLSLFFLFIKKILIN